MPGGYRARIRKATVLAVSGATVVLFAISLALRAFYAKTPYGRWVDTWYWVQIRRQGRYSGYTMTNLGDDLMWGAGIGGILLIAGAVAHFSKQELPFGLFRDRRPQIWDEDRY